MSLPAQKPSFDTFGLTYGNEANSPITEAIIQLYSTTLLQLNNILSINDVAQRDLEIAAAKEKNLGLVAKYSLHQGSPLQKQASYLIAKAMFPKISNRNHRMKMYRKIVSRIGKAFPTVERMLSEKAYGGIHPKAVPATARRKLHKKFHNEPTKYANDQWKKTLDYMNKKRDQTFNSLHGWETVVDEKPALQVQLEQWDTRLAAHEEKKPTVRYDSEGAKKMAERFTTFDDEQSKMAQDRQERRAKLAEDRATTEALLNASNNEEEKQRLQEQLDQNAASQEALAAEEDQAQKDGVKTTGVLVHDLVAKYIGGHQSRPDHHNWATVAEQAYEEAAFLNIVAKISTALGNNRFLPIFDQSGSMGSSYYGYSNLDPVSPAAKGLGLLTTLLAVSNSPYYITFSNQPKVVDVKASWASMQGVWNRIQGSTKLPGLRDLCHIVADNRVSDCGTNWAGTVNLLVGLCNSITPEERPNYLVVFTDGQFNSIGISMSGGYYGGRAQLRACGDHLRQSFGDAGMEAPKVIIWNLNQDYDAHPAHADDDNIIEFSSTNPESLALIVQYMETIPSPEERLALQTAAGEERQRLADEAVLEQKKSTIDLMTKCILMDEVSGALSEALSEFPEGLFGPYQGREMEPGQPDQPDDALEKAALLIEQAAPGQGEQVEADQNLDQLIEPGMTKTANGMLAFKVMHKSPIVNALLEIFNGCTASHELAEQKMIDYVEIFMDGVLEENGFSGEMKSALVTDILSLGMFVRDVRNKGKGQKRAGVTIVVQTLLRILEVDPNPDIVRVVLRQLVDTGSWRDLRAILIALTNPSDFQNPRSRRRAGIQVRQQKAKKERLAKEEESKIPDDA